MFDVFGVDGGEEGGRYLSYEEYSSELDEFNIEYIPVFAILNHPTIDDILALAKKNHYLIPDEENVGEGIVVKTYDYRNKYGRQTWGKARCSRVFRNEAKVKEEEP